MGIARIDTVKDLENHGVLETSKTLVDTGRAVSDAELATELNANDEFGVGYKVASHSDRLCRDVQQLMNTQKYIGADRTNY